MWNRLLVPHDFSDCAARALEVALELARSAKGASASATPTTITLLHVSLLPSDLPPETIVLPPSGSMGSGQPARIDDLAMRGAHRELEAIAEPLRDSSLVFKTIAITTRSGNVAAEILRVAAKEQSDVILVGTHGRKGLAHLVFGSVAEKVVRAAPVPVITVRVSSATPSRATPEETLVEDELAG